MRAQHDAPATGIHLTADDLARWSSSPGFLPMYKSCFDILDRLAQYLDGDKRRDVYVLPSVAQLGFAISSMRLIDRAMTLSTTLMVALAANEKAYAVIQPPCDFASAFGPLPSEYVKLATEFEAFERRVWAIFMQVHVGEIESSDTIVKLPVVPIARAARVDTIDVPMRRPWFYDAKKMQAMRDAAAGSTSNLRLV